MSLVQHNQVIQTLPADRSDESLDVRRLPWCSGPPIFALPIQDDFKDVPYVNETRCAEAGLFSATSSKRKPRSSPLLRRSRSVQIFERA